MLNRLSLNIVNSVKIDYNCITKEILNKGVFIFPSGMKYHNLTQNMYCFFEIKC